MLPLVLPYINVRSNRVHKSAVYIVCKYPLHSMSEAATKVTYKLCWTWYIFMVAAPSMNSRATLGANVLTTNTNARKHTHSTHFTVRGTWILECCDHGRACCLHAVISKCGSFSSLLSSLTDVFAVTIKQSWHVRTQYAKYFVVGANKFVDNIFLYAS